MRTLSVTEVTGYLKEILDDDLLLSNLWVEGEISNFKRAASGHLYFTLKDEYACIRAVMFRSRARVLQFQPEDGMSVRIRGYVSIYERDGMYQLYTLEMEPAGVGALYAAFEQLKNKLAREGLFNREFKKSLPPFPARIGLVTSPVGAAVRDMINIISRRWPCVELILAPVKVQGSSAPREICRAIRHLNDNEDVDVIIVGRGGGSLEELWAFNTELVAREIFNSRVPVVAAVGHETDYTIADLVADLRAPTPSAAAEMVVPDAGEMQRYLRGIQACLARAAAGKVREHRLRLSSVLARRVLLDPVAAMCSPRRRDVEYLLKQAANSVAGVVIKERARLAEIAGRLEALSPLSTLARGYSICTKPGGEIVKKADQVQTGDRVDVRLYKGKLSCTVNKCRF